jgi:hypothetical protein
MFLFKVLEAIFSLGLIPLMDYLESRRNQEARQQEHIDSLVNVDGEKVYHLAKSDRWTADRRAAPHVSETGLGRPLVEYVPPIFSNPSSHVSAEELADRWNKE